MKIVIDIPKESYDFAKECKHNGTSKYNWCLSHNDVVFMVANGTPISDNATNGDIIKAMFNILDSEIDEGLSTTYIYTKTRVLKGGSQDRLREQITFNRDWWNAPYKVETEEK